jgi:hypothetical protein
VAPKKNILKVEPFEDLRVFGIASSNRDYALAWHMNEKLGLNLQRLENLRASDEESPGFPFYYYDEGENQNVFSLVSNNSDGTLLLKMPARTDFFLIIRNPLNESRLSAILSIIRSISGILMVYEIDLAKYKQIDTVLEELEFHEMMIQKKQTRKHHRN